MDFKKSRPIQEAMENGDFKGTLKLCEKKDIAGIPLVKAFKVAALTKLWRDAEAVEFAKTLIEGDLQDYDAIRIIQKSIRDLGLFEESAKLLDLQVNLYPDAVSVWHQRFVDRIRLGQFNMMQILALGMVKSLAQPSYLAWAGTFMVPEAEQMAIEGDVEGARMKLKTCLSVMQKSLNFVKAAFPDPGASLTNVCIIMLQSLVALSTPEHLISAVNLVEDEMTHIQARERLLILAEIHSRGKNWKAAHDCFFKLVSEEDGEDWRNWAGFVETGTMQGQIDIHEQIQHVASNGKRGPKLAAIYAHFLALKNEPNTMFIQSLLGYVEEFGSKSCCFGDIVNFLSVLVGEDGKPEVPPKANSVYFRKTFGVPYHVEKLDKKHSKRWPVDIFNGFVPLDDENRKLFVGQINSWITVSDATLMKDCAVSEKTKSIRRILTCFQVLRYIGHFEKQTRGQTMEVVKQLLVYYEASLGIEADESDANQKGVKVGDDLVILAAHFALDVSYSTENPADILLGVAAILERAHSNSPYGFQISLLLLEVYSKLDMTKRACELYTELDIKHIQFDSLSHIIFGDCVRSGYFEEGLQCCTNLERFWQSSRRENPDFVGHAMSADNFTSALEFVRLDRMLEYSHQRAVCCSEGFFLEAVVHCADKWEDVVEHVDAHLSTNPKTYHRTIRMRSISCLNLKTLSCNYDFTTRVSWDYPNGIVVTAELNSLQSASSGSTQYRGCVASATYDADWVERAKVWIELRVAVSQLWHHVLVDRSPLPSTFLSKYRSLLGQLRFISVTSKEENKGEESLWHASVSVVECIEAVLTGELDLGAAHLFQLDFHIANAMPIQRSLRQWTQDLYNPLLWIVVLVRGLMAAFPKKKKKPLDSFQQQLRSVSKALVAYLENASTTIKETEYTAREFASSSDLAVIKDHIDSKYVAKILVWQQESSYGTVTNLGVICNKYISLFKSLKY